MADKENFFNRAKETIGDREKLIDLVSKSTKRLKKSAMESPEWKEFRSKLNILIRMVQCHISGEYEAFSVSSLILIVFALIYFITPTDAIPDFIPAIGFTDDATILYIIYRKLNKEIERFLRWKGSE